MRIKGVGRLKALATRWRNRVTPGTIILLYHRVIELSLDPQLLCVTPKHFAEHLEVLRKHGVLVSLSQLNQALGKRSVPKRGIIITFDDGAADNLHYAKPLLERHAVPATVFVATGYVKNRREFWWDELEHLLLQPGTLPALLQLNVNGQVSNWDLGELATYSKAAYHQHLGWNVLDQDDPSLRHRLYRALFDSLRVMSTEERWYILEELRTWAGMQASARSTHQALLPEEIRRLAEGGLIEVGAHTVTHPVLSALPPQTQREEIQHSKMFLEEILEQPVKSFAYPYGMIGDYTAETVDIVRELGFDSACSNFTGMVQPSADRFQLPRFVARDWDGDEFERRLKGWFRE